VIGDRARSISAGSDIFLVATSSPLIFGEGIVRRDGTVRFTASVPLEALGAGAHRFRVVGKRDLGGVLVGEDGTIVISDATAAEVDKLDTGTTATVRISGPAAVDGDLELVRYIPLREMTPWLWLLVPILTGLLLAYLRRNRRLSARFGVGLLLGILAGLVPAYIGWIGLFFDLAGVGLLLSFVIPVVLLLVRVRREKGRAGAG
jgi:hypothetical protein